MSKTRLALGPAVAAVQRARARLRLGALAVPLALAACGGSEPAGVRTPSAEPIAFRADASRAPQSPRVYRRWDLGTELPAGWNVLADEHSLAPVPGDDERSMLVLESAETSSIRIRGPHEPQSFNQAIVTLEVLSPRDTLDVGLRGFRKRDKAFERLQTMQFGQGSHALVLDLAGNTGELAPYDSLQLIVRRANRTGLSSFALVHRSVGDWLPTHDEPRPAVVGDEARPCAALSSRRPLSARFAGRAGDHLSFGCGRPEIAARPGENARLTVTVEAPGVEPVVETVALPDHGGWHDVALPLPALAEYEVRFELEAEGADEAFCVVTPPRVFGFVVEPPTVVLVTSDTHRADHVGPARDGAGVRTPFLDELAGRGVFFEDCYASTNITNPSHATLLTGLTPRDTGVRTNVTALSHAAETLAERFQSQGFVTLAVTSVGHMRDDQSGFAQGFDRFYAPERHAVNAEASVARLLDWLPAAEGRPLFVWLHLFDVHTPYDPPAEYRALYYSDSADPYDPSSPELPPEQRTSWDPELRDNEYNLARYKGEVTYVDDQLRELLDRPRLREAILAVTSDHGEALGQHGIWYHHSSLYPATAKVPLLLAWPDAPAGTRIEAPVRQLDVGRTLLDLAGLEHVAFPGVNLLGLDGTAERRYGLSGHGHTATLQEGRWFLSLHLQRHLLVATQYTFQQHELELFDLERDPDCMENVVAEHAEVARAMRARLVHWVSSGPTLALGQTSASQETARLEELAALGYTTDTAGDEEALFELDCTCARCLEWAD